MAENYVLLETINLLQSAASVVFDNIPQTGYTDLKIVVSARTDQTLVTRSFKVQPNGVDITGKRLGVESTSFTPYSDSGFNLYCPGTGATANTFGSCEIHISKYNSTSEYKPLSITNVSENNGADGGIAFTAGLYSSNTAISSITLVPSLGSFVANSTFGLYGLAATGTTPTVAPKATGGNIVANDGTYWYHAFLTSGTFTPQTILTANCLVIGGGGGSGPDASSGQGSGGGAGGVFYATSQSLTATNYTVTIGAGGAAKAANSAVRGDNGTNSQFGSLTAALGGGGGGPGSSSLGGASGGSGGGGGGGSTNGVGGSSTQTGTGGTGYGNSGANGASAQAGGGGGAGAAGSSGNGGAGLNTWSTWASATNTGISGYYAGGGAGWAVGSAGAGNSGSVSGTASVANAPANVGGGGNGYVGAGGSGIVIIRYAMV
jgi:hypothetical protein